MFSLISRKITDFLLVKRAISEKEYKICVYGMEILLGTFSGFSLLIILGLATGQIWRILIFLGVFVPLRQYCGGYHASTHFRCNLSLMAVGCVFLLGASWLEREQSWEIAFLLLISSSLMIWLEAPAINEKKPVTRSIRKQNKKRARIFQGFYALLAACLWMTGGRWIGEAVILALTAVALLLKIGKCKGGWNQWRRKENFGKV